nr:putative ribonuclease H-like domain-containing protein [Tanacetum cinerariifolium]
FFLGLQVKQKKYGIFICQDKYVAEILRKFGLTEGKSASTPFDIEKPLLKDPDGEDVNVHIYSMKRVVKDQGELSQMFNDDFHTCMFACFLSQEEPKRVHQALKDPSWIEAMQEELLQIKMQKVWVLVDLPHGKRAIGTK